MIIRASHTGTAGDISGAELKYTIDSIQWNDTAPRERKRNKEQERGKQKRERKEEKNETKESNLWR